MGRAVCVCVDRAVECVWVEGVLGLLWGRVYGCAYLPVMHVLVWVFVLYFMWVGSHVSFFNGDRKQGR